MARVEKREIGRTVLRMAAAAVVVVAALLLYRLFRLYFGISLPAFILFYPAVMVGALLYGLWAGLLSTALATLLAAIWVFPPTGQLKLQNASDAVALALFFGAGVFTSLVAERHRKGEQRIVVLEREAAARETRTKLEAAMASLSDAVTITDAEGGFIDFNDAFATFHRFKGKAECAKTLAEYPALFELFTVGAEPVSLEMWPIRRALRGETGVYAEYTVRRKDTGEVWFGSYNFGPIRDPDGTIVGSVLSMRDITERIWAEDEVRASEARYRTAFQTSMDAIGINRLGDGKYFEVNQAFLDMTGYDRREVIGKTALELGLWVNRHDRENLIEILKHQPSHKDLQAQFKRKGGQIFWGIVSASTMELEGELCLLSVMRDISEAKLAEEAIRSLAFFDPLTRLPNRRLLMERLGKSIAFSARNHRKRALMFFDLDGFKNLNDTLGHQTGDLMLREVAQRLKDCVREVDTVGRLGGDEFVVMLEDLSETTDDAATQARTIAEKILSKIEQPYYLNGHECFSTGSIGITIFGDNRENMNAVLQQADIAMYQAKAAGRNTLRFFAPELQDAANVRGAMEEDLREGIKSGQFMLYHQPQFENGRLVGTEALLRWNHPRLGVLPADEFISLAEETRQIVSLGNWVLESACRQLSTWAEREQTAGLTLAVNISALQLSEQGFVESVLSILERTGANPRNLKIELTESMLVDKVEEVIAQMTELKSHGVCFSVDDFGTGYSSLSYLKRLPLNQLKIDRSFIHDILMDAGSRAIAQTIISLGHAMGLSVIAEGVETEEQRAFLASLGCHSYQGYLFSRPLPVEQFEEMLQGLNGEAAEVSA